MGMGLKRKNKKGVALLWTLIICLVFLIVTSTMVGYIIKDSQASMRIEDSVQAYAAARTGIDWALVYINPDNQLVTIDQIVDYTKTIQISSESEVTVKVTGTIGASVIIESNGKKLGTKIVERKLRYETKPYTTRVNPGYVVNGDFKMDFDFWLGAPGTELSFGAKKETSNSIELGVEIPTGTNCIYITALSQPSNNCIDLGTEHNLNEPYKFKATLMYTKGVSAILEISQRDSGSFSLSPVGSTSINLIGVTLNPIATPYGLSAGTDSSYVDGSYYQDGVSPYSFVDNFNFWATPTANAVSPLSTCSLTANYQVKTMTIDYVVIWHINNYVTGTEASMTGPLLPQNPYTNINSWSGNVPLTGAFSPGVDSTYTLNLTMPDGRKNSCQTVFHAPPVVPLACNIYELSGLPVYPSYSRISMRGMVTSGQPERAVLEHRTTDNPPIVYSISVPATTPYIFVNYSFVQHPTNRGDVWELILTDMYGNTGKCSKATSF